MEISDVEREREELLEELTSDHGSDWAEQYGPASFGCHELLDRTALIADMVESHLVEHPACVGNRDWFLLAHQAAAALHELYQRVGAAHLIDDEAAPPKGKGHGPKD